jgi:hypothetical protein
VKLAFKGHRADNVEMKSMKTVFLAGVTLMAAILLPAAEQKEKPAPIEVAVTNIWDSNYYSAFTDLARFDGKWFCVFREGRQHVSPDGIIRVITSKDGQKWTSAAAIEMPGYDLRDPKLSMAPDNRLMIVGGATVRDGSQPATASQSFVAYSKDGTRWDKVYWAGPTNYWLWRVTWEKSTAYGVAYDVSPARRNSKTYRTQLVQSTDGVNFAALVSLLHTNGGPTEATLRFGRDGKAFCLQRRDGTPNTALLGVSKPPYLDWQWRDLGDFFGGPNFIQIPDGRWIAAGRLLVKNAQGKAEPKTVVCELDQAQGKLIPLHVLPSGGDNSYPGMVWHDNRLWVSYYSSHEGKTKIYLAQVKLPKR